MQAAQVLIPVDAEIFWQQLRRVVAEVIDEQHTKLREQADGLSTNLLKVKDVCKLFQVSKPTVYEWIRKGQLQSVKIESRRFFRSTDIVELIDRQRQIVGTQ